MRSRKILASTTILVLLLGAIATASVSAAPLQSGGTRQIPSGGTTSIRSGATGAEGIQQPELRSKPAGEAGQQAVAITYVCRHMCVGRRLTAPARTTSASWSVALAHALIERVRSWS